ncbi:MAG: hypothetical protein A2Y18_05665 [Clostridiales bacterium GWD2_32_19]|nr:MAG: hypothetical protein A2Y18_05665 [Clostridiales bacterium GWD2_32_19]
MYMGLMDNVDNKIYNVGIYVRLSKDDFSKGKATDQEVSESIKNQKNMLTKYVMEKSWNIVDIFVDDGVSGASFDRNNFNRMVDMIEAGAIDCVLCKDQSRLGRDHIEEGNYREKYFPSRNVRYIAIDDGVDTFRDTSGNDMATMRSAMNDMYIQDTSKKVKRSFDTKRRNGEFIGAHSPYGYKKDTINKNKLVIDEEVSHIVARIFAEYIEGYKEGKGYTSVANGLNADGVLTPTQYKKTKGNYNNAKARLGLWSAESVRRILTSPTYMGALTQGRTLKKGPKVKSFLNIPKEYWIIVPGTHDPIVSEETFTVVQELIERKEKYPTRPSIEGHLLTGLIFCADCGERMTFHKTNRGTTQCICSKYKRYKGMCSRHAIREEDINKLVLDDLGRIASKVVDVQKLKKMSVGAEAQNQRANSIQIQLDKLKNRVEEIRNIIKSLYTDKVKGIVSEETFIEMQATFSEEKTVVAKKIQQLEEQEKKADKVERKANKRLDEMIEDLVNMKEINNIILKELVDRVEVSENKEVMIRYKFSA